MQQKKFYHKNFAEMNFCPVEDRDLGEFVAFRLSENMLEQLRQKAELEGSDISNCIREILEEHLK